jgi:hypothetical protein
MRYSGLAPIIERSLQAVIFFLNTMIHAAGIARLPRSFLLSREKSPQRLKPVTLLTSCGTDKSVPLHKHIYETCSSDSLEINEET